MPVLQTLKSLIPQRRGGPRTSTSSGNDPRTVPLHSEAARRRDEDADNSAAFGRRPFTGLLSYSQGTSIHDSTLINIEGVAQNIHAVRTALDFLEKKRVEGAEVDSSARDPPPKCHSESRKSLRSRINTWIQNASGHSSFLWLLGPAGVGKSAVAQTIAEEHKALGSLGAAFFFSGSNNCDDPLAVFPTIAYQLAVLLPEYQKLITQRLTEDPTLLEKNLRTQFQKLIVEPFALLMSSNPGICRRPYLIILDGLDECRGKQAQCEFIYLVAEHVRTTKERPLIWIICSRPEWHLKRLLSSADVFAHCKREEVEIDDTESREDVLRFLTDGFCKIRQTFWDVFDENDPWPTPSQIQDIATKSSGLFIFAEAIIRFVSDPDQGNPRPRFEICLQSIRNMTIPDTTNPLHSLDFLYRSILLEIPEDVFPTTKLILGFCLLYPKHNLCTWALANFLQLDRGTFYTALQKLHSVLKVPLPQRALKHRIHFYHASFGDYLRDPVRSGALAIEENLIESEIAIRCIWWCNIFNAQGCRCSDRTQCQLPVGREGISWKLLPTIASDGTGHGLTLVDGRWEEPVQSPIPAWYRTGAAGNAIDYIYAFAVDNIWITISLAQGRTAEKVLAELEDFNFSHWQPVRRSQMPSFTTFLNWLQSKNTSLLAPASTLLEDTQDPTSFLQYLPNDSRGLNIFSYPLLERGFLPFWDSAEPRAFTLGTGGRGSLILWNNSHESPRRSRSLQRLDFESDYDTDS